jgi:lipoprotein-anchoring transpeptidase ErfK/SrfK
MLELVASLVVDLSDQRLTVYKSDQEVVRVIPVSTGKASTPTPIFNSKVFTKYRSTTMYGRTYSVPGVPFTMCVSANEAICLHAAPWPGERRATLRHAHAAMAACACR